MKRCLLVLVVSLAACLPAEPLVRPVSVTGTVRQGGQPVQGAILGLHRPGVNGLPVPVAGATSAANGTYSFATEIEEPRCFLVFVTVEIRDSGGAVAFSDRRNVVGCGDNEVNFDF